MKCFQCEVDLNDENSMQCDGCKRNICLQCSNLTSSEVRVMGLKGKRTLLYLCPACREALFQVPKLIKAYDGLREELDDVKKILSQPSVDPASVPVVTPAVMAAVAPPSTDANAILEEIVDRERRANNIILVGIEESSSSIGNDRKLHDESSVKEILHKITNNRDFSQKYVALQRLGRRDDGKPRPIKVVLASRQDAVMVLKNKNTLCYCDEFCNRVGTPGHDDCCPDYEEKCLRAPSQIVDAPSCTFRGVKYVNREQVEQDCNICTCIIDQYTNNTRWQCSDDQCIISSQVLAGVRGDRDGWTAENYTQFQGKKLKDGLIYKLGTLPLSPAVQHMGPIRYHQEVYEREFDSRRAWPQYISPIIDQGWCGSDWAVALAAVASDKFAVQSNGAESMVLSPQSILSCNKKGQRGCDGGHIDIAWNHVRNFGLVSELCFSYKATRTICPFSFISSLSENCGHPDGQRESRYRMGPAGRLVNENDIMFDIKELGPVYAVMTVYQDFFHYRSGIYKHTEHGDNQQQGLHSVRIVGWGEEYNGDKFWIVANSWGTEWGENGYFRIARGSNESGIESFVVTSTPEVIRAWKRK